MHLSNLNPINEKERMLMICTSYVFVLWMSIMGYVMLFMKWNDKFGFNGYIAFIFLLLDPYMLLSCVCKRIGLLDVSPGIG